MQIGRKLNRLTTYHDLTCQYPSHLSTVPAYSCCLAGDNCASANSTVSNTGEVSSSKYCSVVNIILCGFKVFRGTNQED